MNGHKVVLGGPRGRARAHELIDAAPQDAEVIVRPAKRTLDQNSKMWAMLSDVSIAKPEGRYWTTDTWKAAFLHALGHEIMWEEGLNNSGPFPVGFRSSRLTKAQMSDLITTIQEYGDRHGVEWTDDLDA